MNFNLTPPPNVLIENFDGDNKESIRQLDSFMTANFQKKETKSQIISLRIINAYFKSKDYLVNRLLKKYDYKNGIERLYLKDITNLDINEVFKWFVNCNASMLLGANNDLFEQGKDFHPLQYLHIENLKSINQINDSSSNDSDILNNNLLDIFNNNNSLNYSIKHLVIIGNDYFSSKPLQRIMANNRKWFSKIAEVIIIKGSEWQDSNIIMRILISFPLLTVLEISNSLISDNNISSMRKDKVPKELKDRIKNQTIKSLIFYNNKYTKSTSQFHEIDKSVYLYRNMFSEIDYTYLETLHISSTMSNPNEFLTDEIFSVIMSNCNVLINLNIDYCICLTDQSVMTSLINCNALRENKSLQSISMEGCCSLSVNGVIAFVEAIINLCDKNQTLPCRSITSLNFNNFKTDFNISEMFALQRLKVSLMNDFEEYKCNFIYSTIVYQQNKTPTDIEEMMTTGNDLTSTVELNNLTTSTADTTSPINMKIA